MLEIKQCILTNNDCYKSNKNKKHKVAGVMVHSTGANNPNLSRYLGPDDGIIGQNKYGNHWNQSGISKCVHAMIGKDINGVVRVYQTLPWEMPGWHSGSGSKGQANNANNTGYIGFEMLEDDLTDRNYFNEVYNKAVELTAYLCDRFGLEVNSTTVIGHVEGHKLGIASNHGDPEHWFKKFGKNMATFREDVKKLLSQNQNSSKYTVKSGDTLIKIAQKHNTTLEEILKVNSQIKNPSLIYVGDVINIPTQSSNTDYKTLYENEKKRADAAEAKIRQLEAEGQLLKSKILSASEILKL